MLFLVLPEQCVGLIVTNTNTYQGGPGVARRLSSLLVADATSLGQRVGLVEMFQ